MAPTARELHRRTHNLLFNNQLSSPSPFTLILDSLEQKAGPLLDEYASRAKDSKVKIVLCSFQTIKTPDYVDALVNAWELPSSAWQKRLHTEVAAFPPPARVLLIIDSLNVAGVADGLQLPALLSSLLSPQLSLVAIYHTDIPSVETTTPSTLSLMKYLATTVMTVHSLSHVLARKAARDRSVMEPEFGLGEGIEGVLQGLGSNSSTDTVVEMEHRRRSGRGVKEWFVLQRNTTTSKPASGRGRPPISLLDDYPGYNNDIVDHAIATTAEASSTFELGLTERQRQDREGVVLPYFDAQKGNDEGGRILYDMGSEDDFDEEEDEI